MGSKIFEKAINQSNYLPVPMPGRTLVEISGDHRILIENHRGVSFYNDTKICVHSSYGEICILGKGVSLPYMTKQQLIITGEIDSVSLLRGEKV